MTSIPFEVLAQISALSLILSSFLAAAGIIPKALGEFIISKTNSQSRSWKSVRSELYTGFILRFLASFVSFITIKLCKYFAFIDFDFRFRNTAIPQIFWDPLVPALVVYALIACVIEFALVMSAKNPTGALKRFYPISFGIALGMATALSVLLVSGDFYY